MHATRYRRPLALVLATLAMVVTATSVAAPAQAEPLCSITYRAGGWDATDRFPAGFQAEFILVNNATRNTVGWRVEVHYQAGVEVKQNWNAVVVLDADPIYVFGNGSWNGEMQARGGEQSFGLIAQKSANDVSNYPQSAVCSPIF
jgi:hypothetical protein